MTNRITARRSSASHAPARGCSARPSSSDTSGIRSTRAAPSRTRPTGRSGKTTRGRRAAQPGTARMISSSASQFRITNPATATHGGTRVPCTRGTPCVTLPEGKNIDGRAGLQLPRRTRCRSAGPSTSLQIYRQVLDAAEIRTIFLGTYTALNLGLDEAPGSTSFADASAGHHDGGCSAPGSAATCPTAGLGGRVARAVLFNAGEQDHLIVAGVRRSRRPPRCRPGSIAPRAPTPAQRSFPPRKAPDCGFTLALNDDGASQYPMFSAWITNGGSSALQKVEFAEAVPLNTWVHLAGVYDGRSSGSTATGRRWRAPLRRAA